MDSIVGKLPVVLVGDAGTIQYGMAASFLGAHDNSSTDAGDGCRMWYVNSWALGWYSDT